MKTALGLALVLAVPSLMGQTIGQTYHSVSLGVIPHRQFPAVASYQTDISQGFAVAASWGRQATRRAGWRLDAFVRQVYLDQPLDFAGVMCSNPPAPGACCGICPGRRYRGQVGVTGLSASVLENLVTSHGGLGLYMLGGFEMDYLYRHPETPRALRLGYSIGGGVDLPAIAGIRGFVEMRFHALVDGPSQPTALAPISVGVRF